MVRVFRGVQADDDGGGDIRGRLRAWIAGDVGGFSSFDEAAAVVFSWQHDHNHAYRRYWEALGVPSPGADFDWRAAPALPTDAFKVAGLPPRSIPGGAVRHTFVTSGTTREVRGRHEFSSLDLYEQSIRHGWRQLGLPEPANPWFLSPPAEAMPDSSLAHMFATLGDGRLGRWMMDADGRIDTNGLAATCGPAGVFATSIALFRLFEEHPPIPLPGGSWVFETGGAKGLAISLDPVDFRARIAAFFSIPAARVLNEYSMTELSSQFYRWPDEPAHRGPHWTRIRVVDPETNAPADSGKPGYLEIIDLANLDSVAAIRTQDIAIARGPSDFELLGRDPAAVPRGCSRAAEDLWSRVASEPREDNP